MNFLKSCKTNVYLLEDLRKLHYGVHRARQSTPQSDILQLVAELRKERVLCASTPGELVVYFPLADGDIPDHAQIVKRVLESRTGALDESAVIPIVDNLDATTDGGHSILDLLFAAVDGALHFSLQSVPGMLRIAPQTWLYIDGADDARNVWLRLHLHVTPATSLYATIITDESPVCQYNVAPIQSGQDVLVAPAGIICQAEAADTATVANSAWKDTIMTWLSYRGIAVGANKPWTPVNLFPGRLVLWPSQLLLFDRNSGSSFQQNDAWKRWFISNGEKDSFHCPLAVAEECFTGASERERSALDEKQRPMDVQAPTQGTDATAMLASSPPFVQRIIDQQAAASGIYPTPPDGLVPAIQTQTQPDNVMQLDMTTSQADAPLVAPEATPLPQAIGTFTDSDQFQAGTDDLFGDAISGMDFTGDVGDADFSFFDEPDEVEQKDVEMQDSSLLETKARGDGGANAVSSEVLPDAEHATHEAEECMTVEHPGLSVDTGMILLDDKDDSPQINSAVEKPLSPFGVKERLLPPPIPASARLSEKADVHKQSRRSSTFDPVIFRDGLQLNRKFASNAYIPTSTPQIPTQPSFDISLPPRRKKPRTKSGSASHTKDLAESESEDDSYESESSSSDDDLPPKLPWDTKKRKRASWQDATAHDDTTASEHEDQERRKNSVTDVEAWSMLFNMEEIPEVDPSCFAKLEHPISTTSPVDLFSLSKMDLVYIAQIICDQSVSSMPALSRDLSCPDSTESLPTSAAPWAILTATENTFQQPSWSAHSSDVFSLALVKEPPPRTASTPGQPRPGLPRSHHRSDSSSLGPDVFPLAPPFLSVRRGQDRYEMLPPALDFWETLGLGPSHGPKDIRAFCVFPWNEDLQRLVDNFLSDVGTAYESCKFGSHIHVRNVGEDSKVDDYEDGLAPVECDGQLDLDSVLRAYGSTCRQLGKFLAGIGHEESDKTIVVYMVNPFGENACATQYLSSCFWMLCKAYRDYAPKMTKKESRSDVVLQVLPIDLVASPDAPVILTPRQMALLVREVYDRCPPPESSGQNGDAIPPCLTAPSVELAGLPPKRIGFQLVADPPSDLMHEGSIIHLAYTTSDDGLWITAAWIDTTGRYQTSQSFCLRGRSFAEVVEEVWERTKDLLASRDVFWRVFIVTESDCDESIVACWRKVAERPRKQPFGVTFLLANSSPKLRLSPPIADDNGAPNMAGFLTPATTPGGTALIISPDTGQNTAPPTPAPSDSVITLAENDPEAHLINLEDDAWGLLLSSNYTHDLDAEIQPLSSGTIYRRGEAGLESTERPPSSHLPSLQLDLLWTLQVRPNSVVEAGQAKVAETTLREVLKLFRNLSVLTRAKGIENDTGDSKDCSALPLHLIAARKAAKNIDGLLR